MTILAGSGDGVDRGAHGWRPAWFAHTVLVVLVLATVAAAVLIIGAPVDLTLLPSGPDQVVGGRGVRRGDPQPDAGFQHQRRAGLLYVLGRIDERVFYFGRTRAFPNRVTSRTC